VLFSLFTISIPSKTKSRQPYLIFSSLAGKAEIYNLCQQQEEMSNTDSSASARLRQIKAQTLANFHAQNPQAREGGGSKSADASVVVARAPGAYPVTRQIDSKPAQVIQACCST
jgi:hypothetical protein